MGLPGPGLGQDVGMATASDTLHEENLPAEVVDRHRAIVSIMEELEAVDWYDQRVHANGDAELAEILGHNRDEEKEHAAMTLEWLRRRDSKFDEMLRTYLFTEGSILEVEESSEAPHQPPVPEGSLGIGSLKGITS